MVDKKGKKPKVVVPKPTKKAKSSGTIWWVVVGVVVLLIGVFWNDPIDDGKPVVVPTSKMSKKQVAQRRESLDCVNREDDSYCDSSAASGSCDVAPGWMSVFCAASCGTCELLDPKVRCDENRIGYKRDKAWETGSVDALFSNLGSRFPEYEVEYLSRPPDGPWVVRFNNFVTEQEADALIDQAGGNLRRSTDQGEFDENGIQEQVESTGRTSRNAWCVDECERHPDVVSVTKRIEKVTGIPKKNYESFQLLRYDLGQEYQRHHDSSQEDNELLSGPRILTFFLYLSDVEEGGGTQFTDLDPPLTNQPRRGSAILWPSVLNEDPTKIDHRTYHRAMPVIKGTKLAANSWIHLYEYETPNLWGCTGSFTELED
uniref:Fe2OG dioxygenase domain-containing protein n=1 Tax=Mucochytrium quahogii TaxID=96639 RepID=A0A7S2WI37_9STRA